MWSNPHLTVILKKKVLLPPAGNKQVHSSTSQTEPSCEDPALDKKETEVEVGWNRACKATPASVHFSYNCFQKENRFWP